MKIKQVEELVGISSKNIRFYEERGLLAPSRADNGYREYHNEDIVLLEKIKFFRKLGISVDEIRALFSGNAMLKDCLFAHLKLLEKEQTDLINRQRLTDRLIEQDVSMDNFDCRFWLDEMALMEREGVNFLDVDRIDIHRRKKAGAFAGGIIMIMVMLFIAAMGMWGMASEPKTPLAVIILIIGIPLAIIAAIIFVMVKRIKEIDKGEEDEALKY